jgi:tetratricopeptide (TPR) repeat protein
MVAHASGRWKAHTRWELSEVWHLPQLAGRVFDAHLCVTEYVLHAGHPHDRLIRFAEDLRRHAHESGARRGEAFSATVLGEAQLLAGDAAGARDHLAEAARISREVGAVGGEALARARLGEALDALGDRAGARAHLEQALELAHASTLAEHLLFLVHTPLLRLQDDLDAAVALVDASEALLAEATACNFCPVGYRLAAASVCARAGQAARAETLLELAERSTGLWPPGVWSPAVCEVRGEILRARGEHGEAGVVLRRALEGYAAAGQRLNEQRVARLLTEPSALVAG